MPKVRNFDKLLLPFIEQLSISVSLPKINIEFKCKPVIEFPREVGSKEVVFLLLTRVAHFIAMEISPRSYDDIAEASMKLLGANDFFGSDWEKTSAIKYFLEIFSNKTWMKRDITKNNSDNSGRNHLVLLGEYKEEDWYSLKLNRYHSLSNYSLMIGYRDKTMRIYKFGRKH